VPPVVKPVDEHHPYQPHRGSLRALYLDLVLLRQPSGLELHLLLQRFHAGRRSRHFLRSRLAGLQFRLQQLDLLPKLSVLPFQLIQPLGDSFQGKQPARPALSVHGQIQQ